MSGSPPTYNSTQASAPELLRRHAALLLRHFLGVALELRQVEGNGVQDEAVGVLSADDGNNLLRWWRSPGSALHTHSASPRSAAPHLELLLVACDEGDAQRELCLASHGCDAAAERRTRVSAPPRPVEDAAAHTARRAHPKRPRGTNFLLSGVVPGKRAVLAPSLLLRRRRFATMRQAR